MKILLIFSLCLISDGGAVMEVTGYSGGGVLIICKYQTEYTQNMKYFCRGSPPDCSDQKKTGSNKWINSGRFSLFDETKSSEFRVMIRELTLRDTGTYHCGVDISFGRDIYTPVKLKVKEDLSYEKSMNESVHVGGDLTISCNYPESLRSNPKFLCRMKPQYADYFCELFVQESRTDVHEGHVLLFDNKESQILTVSISNVNKHESGEYWCGAEVSGTTDHGYRVYFTRIDLTLTELPAVTIISVSVSLLLLIGIILLIVIIHWPGPETRTKTPRRTKGDHNDTYVLRLQSTQATSPPESVYQSMKSNTIQSDSVYESLEPRVNQSDSVYESLKTHPNPSESVYQNPTPTNQNPPTKTSCFTLRR